MWIDRLLAAELTDALAHSPAEALVVGALYLDLESERYRLVTDIEAIALAELAALLRA